jgi:hypothetical protein
VVSWDDSSVWLVSTLVFFGLMPLWKKRRAYFISAGILFFPRHLFYIKVLATIVFGLGLLVFPAIYFIFQRAGYCF